MKKMTISAMLAACSLVAHANVTNLVTNGDFETGTFAGWTKSGNTSLTDVIKNTVTSNHSYLWRSGATGSPAYISQVLSTQVGSKYTLEFDVYNTSTSNSTFEAFFGGTLVYSFANTAQNWAHIKLENLTAAGTATELKFGARNDPSFTRLDNVSVTAAVPEPETYALMLAGLAGIAAAARRRKAV